MSYVRFEPMVEDARRFPSLWRLLTGGVTVVFIAFVWMFVLALGLGLLTGKAWYESLSAVLDPGAPSPSTSVLYLFLIVGIGLGALIAARFWQRRRAGSLFGPTLRTLTHFAVAAGLAFGVMTVLALAALPFIEHPIPNLPWDVWLVWLPLGALAVAAQTGSEELFFRGYLQSQLAARFKSPTIWLLGPALIFGGIHYLPELPIASALAFVTVAALFGILAGDLTARTGSIGAAWGFHFANNALVILIVSSDSALTGLSLFKSATSLSETNTLSPLIAIEVLTLAAIWALIRRVLAT